MATWADVQRYLRSQFTISQETPQSMKLEFQTSPSRSQLVFLSYETLRDGTEEWLRIESPFARVGEIDLSRVLAALEDKIVGGLGSVDGTYLVLRHSLPLENLDINELVRPMELIVTLADAFEFDLSGQDRF